jgi:hypothetical protein
MKIKAIIQVEYNESEDAKIVFKSLNPENKGFITSSINKDLINFNIDSNSLKTFLSTVDDLIFSELTVEKIIESASSN